MHTHDQPFVAAEAERKSGIGNGAYVSLDLLDVGLKYCSLVKRSGTLEGSLPQRAAQHCLPLVEGTMAGFQIQLSEPLTLQLLNGNVEASMTPSIFDETQDKAALVIGQLVARGLLQKDGFWHRLLSDGAMPVEGKRMWFWTGFLVKPRPGIWLLIDGARNRRSRIVTIPHVVSDSTSYTPLVIEIDGSTLSQKATWLQSEFGCVLPMSPGTSFRETQLADNLGVGQEFCDFFSDEYFEEKKGAATSRYRKLASKSPAPADIGPCVAEVTGVGPSAISFNGYHRFASAEGVVEKSDLALPYVEVRSIVSASARFDGDMFTGDPKCSFPPRALQTMRDKWTQWYGPRGGSALDFLSSYFVGPKRGEPYFLVQPWTFLETPAGWSTVVDGVHADGYDGLRGVVATDVLRSFNMAYRILKPGLVRIERDQPLLRAMPVPRHLLRSQVEIHHLPNLSQVVEAAGS